ncbi:gag/pol protein [Cucumis melo var. makuwa]|uniref:Gag/pol protein n=1 Tax=Cucumis melo var. makuwa TaxID=1194695 RepID=A0A5D3DU99_CUCMM|nr:gag/pol protein [Cucumis melo var. makuwa]TYK27347.1 gag/pol protein [Cucumis melo var. makuwa]
MRDYKPQRKLVLNEATDESTRVVDEVGPSSRVDETTTSSQSHPSQSLRMPCHCGRIVSQSYRYLSLTETQVVIPDDGVEECFIVSWLHFVFRAKLVGNQGGGVTTCHATTYLQMIQVGSRQDVGSYQGLIRKGIKYPESSYGGSTDPADAEVWLNMLEKYFDVMSCPEERKVRLATFLLQKETEGWWKSILARHSDARTLDC